MMKSLLLLSLILTFARAATFYKSSETPSLSRYAHAIQINSTSNRTDCSTDLTGPLREAFKYNKSVELQLSKGCFVMSSNELATFSGWTDFAIVGKGKDVSVVTCSDRVGFTFLLSVGITFRDVQIKGCGRIQTSTSKNFTTASQNSDDLPYLEFWVGMYFLSCGNITMDHVEVRESEGVGVVVYNCNGTNTFNSTNFVVNYVLEEDRLGWGGVAVEFSFCQPGDPNCKSSVVSSFQVTQSSYMFYNCCFRANGDQSQEPTGTILPYPHGTEHVAFGKGGGLSVIFKGRSSGNSITIDSCIFKDNSALWGGGLYTSFGDQSIDNRVTVTGSKFIQNVNYCKGNSPDWRQSGGGAQIDFMYYPTDNEVWPGYQPNVLRNSVRFYDTGFASNMACWGGAVSIVISRESPGHPATNSVLFEKCRFNYNQANIAAAVDVSVFQPDLITSNGTLMEPVFKDCQFVENRMTFTDATNFQTIMGAVYANLVPLSFTGTTNFTANDGTALVVSGTYVSLSESSGIIFERNLGRHGGALAFIGNSWLVVHKNAHVTFQNNSATGLGGAVYSVHFGEHDLMYKQNCFFQYYKATLPPSKWNATFRFTGNLVKNKPNSIYTTSVLPCVWPNAATITLQMNNTFCGHPWAFDTDLSCVSEVSTGPSNLWLRNISINAIPGWNTSIPVVAFNDFGDQIQTVFTAAPCKATDKKLIEVSNATEYIADNTIIVHGVANTNANLLLKTLDPRVISSQLRVDIKDCPPGYSRQNCSGDPNMVCNCMCTNSFYGIGCHNESHYIKVYRYNCLTYWYEGETSQVQLVSGRCPYHQASTTLESFDEFDDDKICGRYNRRGTLCSKCKDGTGVSVNDYTFSCVKCYARYSWFLYIITELVPVVIFFIIVTFFNISLTSAPTNAFVFFSQIVTVPYYHNPYTFTHGIMSIDQNKTLEALISIPYGIWNLDFFATSLIPGFCLEDDLRTLEIIALKYLIAFLPLLLIIICCILIELHGRNCRCIRFTWYPFRSCLKKIYKNRKPKTSIIDAFAAFLLLSYSKVMYVSFSLIASTTLHSATGDWKRQHVFYFDASQQMFSGKYAVLSVTATVIFALFVALLPLFLILYPLRCFQRIIDKFPFGIALRTFAEAFNGDFRDGTYKDGSKGDNDCRRYAGYYFLLRVIVFIIFICELTWLEQYFIQQLLFSVCIVTFAAIRPYKVEFYNMLDTSIFLLLAILNACSFYNSQHNYNYEYISKPVFWINYLLIFLPLVYIIGYCIYLILLWKGCIQRWTKPKSPMSESIIVINDPSSMEDNEGSEVYPYTYNSRESEEDIPDRLVNPQNYNRRNLYKPHDQSAADPFGQKLRRPRQGSSEKSYFLGERDAQFVPYGSFSTSERHSEPIVRPSSLDRRSGSVSTRNSNTKSDSSSKRSSVHFQGVV